MGEMKDARWDSEEIKIDCPHCNQKIIVTVETEAEIWGISELKNIQVT